MENHERTPQSIAGRDLMILLGVSLILRIAIAVVVAQPGYPDAAYYFDVAKNLASGHGFTEDFIFTYLAPANSVVHPSNLYWMPLTSIIIAPFLALFGTSWHVAQIPIILLSASLPLLAYWIGWDIFQSRRYAFAMALFTLIAPSYSFYFAVSDGFALYGWVSLLALVGMYQGWRGHPWRFALAGIAIGLAHLTRADGILLLVVGCLIWLCSQKKRDRKGKPIWKSSCITQLHPIPWQALLGMVCFYLLTMAPWFFRNITLIGSPLPPWETTPIWLTNYYSDFFSFHKAISPHTYLAWGLSNILSSKVQALGDNFIVLASAVSIPVPFALLGIWIGRRRAELLPFLIHLLLLYIISALAFTFLGITGMFFHSVMAPLPLLQGWAIVGMDSTIAYIDQRFGKPYQHAREEFRPSSKISPKGADHPIYLVIVMVASVIVLGKTTLDQAIVWNSDYNLYQNAGKIVASDYRETSKFQESIQPVVMVGDSPEYYYATGQHAVALPPQDLSTVLDAAQEYSVTYILFSSNDTKEERQLWQRNLTGSRLKLIWTSPSGKLYRVLRLSASQK